MNTNPLPWSGESARLSPSRSPRQHWGIAAICSLVVGGCLLAASRPVLAYESRGARSCVIWQEYRRDQIAGYPLNSETYQTWLIGYLSGIVAGSGMDFLAGTDNESVFQMVDGYCSANLLMNLAAAGTYVARDLMQQKGIVNRGTLP
jgi:hypothetical protein